MRERIMNVMKKKEENKGFTLVELIVVIVILAILAAILIPGLLKWIDKAKEEQYTLEARNIYLAVQADIAQAYAKDSTATPPASYAASGTPTSTTDLNKLADVKSITSVAVTYDDTNAWQLKTLTANFESKDGKSIKAEMDANKTWKITVN